MASRPQLEQAAIAYGEAVIELERCALALTNADGLGHKHDSVLRNLAALFDTHSAKQTLTTLGYLPGPEPAKGSPEVEPPEPAKKQGWLARVTG